MYKMNEFTTTDAIAGAGSMEPPMGPGFTPDELAEATCLEVWGTTFDEDPERVEFRLYRNSDVLGIAVIPGY